MRPMVLLCVVFALCSCASTPKPPIDIAGRKLLVLPFGYKSYYFGQHPLGEELAQLVRGVVAARVEDVTLCEAEPFGEMFRGKAPNKVDWRSLAFAAGADYILAGRILLFRERNPLDVNIYQGTMEVEAEVYDRQGRLVKTRLVRATYPYRHPEFGGPPAFGLTREEVAQRTKERAAILIARLFYSPKKGEE